MDHPSVAALTKSFNTIGAVAIPMGFIAAHWQWPSAAKGAIVVATFAATVQTLETAAPGLPKNHPGALMTCFLGFLAPVKLTQMLFFPPKGRGQGTAEVGDSDAKTTQKSTGSPTLMQKATRVLRAAGGFFGNFAWYMMPINAVPAARRPDAKRILLGVAEGCLCYGLKTIVTPALRARCLALEGNQSTLMHAHYLLWIWCTTAPLDIMAAAIPLLSWGRLSLTPFFNYPALAESMPQLWRSWNGGVHTMLKECVFTPAREYFGASVPLASALSFAMSGVFHAFFARYVFSPPAAGGAGPGGLSLEAYNVLLFMAFGVLASLETEVRRRFFPRLNSSPALHFRALRWLTTMGALSLMLPHLARMMPSHAIIEYIHYSPEATPAWAEAPAAWVRSQLAA